MILLVQAKELGAPIARAPIGIHYDSSSFSALTTHLLEAIH